MFLDPASTPFDGSGCSFLSPFIYCTCHYLVTGRNVTASAWVQYQFKYMVSVWPLSFCMWSLPSAVFVETNTHKHLLNYHIYLNARVEFFPLNLVLKYVESEIFVWRAELDDAEPHQSLHCEIVMFRQTRERSMTEVNRHTLIVATGVEIPPMPSLHSG